MLGTFGNQELYQTRPQDRPPNTLLPLFLRPCTLTHSVFCLTEYKDGACIQPWEDSRATGRNGRTRRGEVFSRGLLNTHEEDFLFLLPPPPLL